MQLAHIMLGDRQSAEDVVQEAFCGLYRRWSHLSDTGRALPCLRTSVLNGCRSVQRRRAGPRVRAGAAQQVVSAEAAVISGEDRREMVRALRRLPARRREALVNSRGLGRARRRPVPAVPPGRSADPRKPRRA
jgi:DNA-directed RNA polymerase specialized sigma24 family protein